MNGEGISLVGPSFPANYVGRLPAGVFPYADANGNLTSSSLHYLSGLTAFMYFLSTVRLFINGTWYRKVINTASTPYTLTEYDVLLITTGAGAFVVNLNTAISLQGLNYTFKKVDAGAGQVTITPTGGQTIDGAASYVLTAINKYVTIVSDNANWKIISNN